MGLVGAGLAVAKSETMKAAGRSFGVVRFVITDSDDGWSVALRMVPQGSSIYTLRIDAGADPTTVPSALPGIRNPSRKVPRRRPSLGWRRGCLPEQGGEEQGDYTHLLLASA